MYPQGGNSQRCIKSSSNLSSTTPFSGWGSTHLVPGRRAQRPAGTEMSTDMFELGVGDDEL